MTDAEPFDDPDVTTQTEDDDPETLAGDPVEFDPDASDDDEAAYDGEGV